MKIVQICPYDLARPGGVQAHVRDLSAWLVRAGHDVRVVAPHPLRNAPLAGIDHCGRAIKAQLFGTGFEISYARSRDRGPLIGALRDWGAELVHLHTPWTPFMAWQVWRDLDLPTVTTFHATLPEEKTGGLAARALRRAARHFLTHSRAAIVPSATPLAHLRPQDAGIAAHVLPPAIDLAPWQAVGAQVRRADDTTDTEIVFLGRFEARKGLGVLLAAWPEVAARFPRVRLTVAGGGPQEGLVREAMTGAGGERIRFVPSPDADSARRLVAKADLLVAPSLYGESFGLILIEAMAAGTLPVAAANEGYRTVLTGPGEQLLVRPGDASALAVKLIDLCADAPARRALGAWALPHALSFGVEATGPAFVEIYRDALRS
ncbi:glycosyltransferase family 4 protein [Stappia stellulata]|uniref:glycosyltransferase family 4 protein n=1 Tax=Stappia stellulata TaxID=71235 RepID=UPI000424BEA2|nr:glycosyltransferase family 4 protein [Stappia stellulata]